MKEYIYYYVTENKDIKKLINDDPSVRAINEGGKYTSHQKIRSKGCTN